MAAVLDKLNNYFPAIHSVIFVIGLFSNSTLLLAAFLRTPRTLTSYSVMIKVGTLNDLISVFVDFYTMQSTVPEIRKSIHVNSLLVGLLFDFYLSEGPCSLVSARSCYLAYCMQMCFQIYSIYVITASFAFRLWILHRSMPKSRNVLLFMLVLYLPPALLGFSFSFAQAGEETVRNFLLATAPSYLSEPEVLTGHSGLTIYLILVLLFCVLTPGPAYAAIIVKRMKALTVHALLPPIAILAVLCFILLFFDIYRHPTLEKAMYIWGTLPTALAALCTLYYVEPYRRFVLTQLRRLHVPRSKVSPATAQEAFPSTETMSSTL